MFQKIKKFDLPVLEERVLDFWKEINVFESLKNKEKGKEKFVFYEGPPTANGKPGIHHVLARIFKDIILRHRSMKGYCVTRKAGWDTHGLPVELEVEKRLGFNSKEEIEEYGVEKFNQKCKESVWKYKDEWEELTKRIGFWIDMKKPYITYENSYMESVWWILKQVWDKKLLYKGYKIVPWCPRCGTALSSHELAQGYKEVTETSVYMKFKLKNRQKVGDFEVNNNTYILSWTTTPWTLPGNIALAVGEDIDYLILESNTSKEIYIIGLERKDVLEGDYKELGRVKGRDLVGLGYIPLFDLEMFKNSKTAYKIYPADFVTTKEGTGVVHTAVMYGEDDYQLGKKAGLPEKHTVNEKGLFVNGIPGLSGMRVKNKESDEKIFTHLKENNFLLKTKDYTHEYPYCWRCGTPVLYYGRNSWFIAMSKLREKLVSENNKINWIPGHIKEGRFGEWINSVKDWALSRDRYWGTPLPVWECRKCGNKEAIGSFSEISERLGGARNEYFLMRHGEAESNVRNIINSNPENKELFGLTKKGKKQVEKEIKKIKKAGVDIIFSSDFRRTRETAEIISKSLGLEMKTDERLREINIGFLDGCSEKEYHKHFVNLREKLERKPERGENLRDVSKRVFDFLEEIEKKYKDKKVLIISHDYPLWMTGAVMEGKSEEKAVWEKEDRKKAGKKSFMETGELRRSKFMKLPRNLFGFADFHRPYIDKISFPCSKCGGEMKRVPEVIDVWFDAGSMPFAQTHFPFEQKKGILKNIFKTGNKLDYPADYITEGLDQTRGWFYTLLAISSLLGYERPYKNVISLGLILDKYGRKMSKSKNNTVDPWEVVRNFGADALRWHFYTVGPPGEPKKFDEKDIKKVLRNFLLLLYNSFSFLDLYTNNIDYRKDFKPNNILDKWIISRLDGVINLVGEGLNSYDVGGAAKEIEILVNDLSRWYVRRSRKRFQEAIDNEGIGEDFKEASFVLGYILLQISKISAPFIPFVSEALYQSLKEKMKGYDFKPSVHLENWPGYKKIDVKLENKMKVIREIASTVLSKREEAEIKVKQPLGELKINSRELENDKQLLELLKEEVNVKSVVFDGSLENLELDTEITEELKQEGRFRELIRSIQKGRQDMGLDPKDKINLGIDGEEIGKLALAKREELKKGVRAENVYQGVLKNYDLVFETNLGGYHSKITIKKF